MDLYLSGSEFLTKESYHFFLYSKILINIKKNQTNKMLIFFADIQATN